MGVRENKVETYLSDDVEHEGDVVLSVSDIKELAQLLVESLELLPDE